MGKFALKPQVVSRKLPKTLTEPSPLRRRTDQIVVFFDPDGIISRSFDFSNVGFPDDMATDLAQAFFKRYMNAARLSRVEYFRAVRTFGAFVKEGFFTAASIDPMLH